MVTVVTKRKYFQIINHTINKSVNFPVYIFIPHAILIIMSLFEDLYRKLFAGNPKRDVHEPLRRSAGFMNDFRMWMDEIQSAWLLEDIGKKLQRKLDTGTKPLDIHIYHSDYANGFVIYPEISGEKIPLSFLMEFLKTKMLDLSYRLVHAGRTMKEKNGYIETLELYQLKPPFSLSIPLDQRYGNVLIELSKHNNEEHRLKFLVNIYSDRKYTVAKQYSELISLIFENRSGS